MGYEEIVSLDADTTIALGGRNKKTGKNNPTEIEGYYLGSRKVESKKAKAGFAYIHFFQTSKGNVGVWGKTDLDRKILGVAPGTMTLAAFDKMVPTPNGEMYKYKVAVDKENTIEVAAVALGSSDSGSFSSDDATGDTDVEATTEEEDDTTALERQARVQEILNRGKAGKTTSLKK